MCVDEASNARGAGIGIVLVLSEGLRVEHSLRLSFWALNNEAEYEALIMGHRAARKLDAKEVEIFLASLLVVNQVEGSFESRDPQMAEYLKLVGTMLTNFQKVKVSQFSKG